MHRVATATIRKLMGITELHRSRSVVEIHDVIGIGPTTIHAGPVFESPEGLSKAPPPSRIRIEIFLLVSFVMLSLVSVLCLTSLVGHIPAL